MSNPRRVALQFLQQVDEGRHADELSARKDFLELSAADRALARELVFGCLRQQLQLDYLLARLSSRPLQRMDSTVLWVLRLGAYQIRFLRVPEHAAVHTSVELVRKSGFTSARGLVNAVLRNLIRKPPRLPGADDSQSLSVQHSHPEWLVTRWIERWGVTRARIWMEKNNTPPQGVFWVNPLFGSREEFLKKIEAQDPESLPHPELPRAVRLSQSVTLPAPAPWEPGFFMDEGSQLVVSRQIPPHAQACADLCAAPGGKSFLLASELPPGARLVISDRSRRRLGQLRTRAAQLGLSSLKDLLQSDATRPPFRPASFDFVLLDVPCSGLGTIRSNPDIRWRIQESDLLRFQGNQVEMLCHSIPLLRPGGRLLYSTCSSEPEENEAVVEKTMEAFPDSLKLESQWSNLHDERAGDCFFRATLTAV